MNKIGCVQHDCAECQQQAATIKEMRELLEWAVANFYTHDAAARASTREISERAKDLRAQASKIPEQEPVAVGVPDVDGLLADLRSRINPQYANQRGTESYERKQCAEALDALQDQLTNFRHANKWQAGRIKELETELAQYKAEAPLCEKHKPNGGARSTCLICVCLKLSAAIDRIDYACGEPNEMGVSGYTVHCNEDVVVENVQKLKAERDALKAVFVTVMNIPNMSDQQLAELKANAQTVIDAAMKGEA